MEYLVIPYWMTRCKTDSPVLLKNFLLLAIVKLAFQSDCHTRA